MKKPDQDISSKINSEFDDMSGLLVPVDQLERLKNVGELLFDRSDIYATADKISRIFRKLCVENNISETYFAEKYKQYAINTLGKFPQNAVNNKSNIVKMVKYGERLTWKKFLELAVLVLGFDIEDITMKIKNTHTGEVQTISPN